MQPVGIIFKGSGFYSTDYKNGGASKAGDSMSDLPKTTSSESETAPATKGSSQSGEKATKSSSQSDSKTAAPSAPSTPKND